MRSASGLSLIERASMRHRNLMSGVTTADPVLSPVAALFSNSGSCQLQMRLQRSAAVPLRFIK